MSPSSDDKIKLAQAQDGPCAQRALAALPATEIPSSKSAEINLRSVLDGMSEGFALLDSEFRVIDINAEMLRLELRGRDELIGVSHWDLYPGTEHSSLGHFYKQAMRERVAVSLEHGHVWADGRISWLDMRAYPVEADKLAIFFRDVSDRKAAEELRHLSEQRFRGAIEAVADILWTNNAQGQMIGEQPGWAALTGQSFDDYQGYGWSIAVHPDDAQPTIDAWERAVAEKRQFNFEHRVRRYDGVWRSFSIRAVPLLSDDGSVREWVGVHTDITDAREINSRFRQLAENISAVFYVHEIEKGLISYVSPAYERVWEASTSDLYTDPRAFIEGVHPDDRGMVEAAMAHQLRGENTEIRYRLAFPDGRIRQIHDRAFVTHNPIDGTLRVVGIAEDVTLTTEARLQLARSAETFKSLVRNDPFGVFVVDRDFKLAEVSLGAADLFAGIEPLIGRDFAEILSIVWKEPFASTAEGHFRQTLATGESFVSHMTIEPRADTDEMSAIDWRIDRIVLPDGRNGVVCYFYDLSERIALEMQQSRAEKSLQETTSKLDAVLNNASVAIMLMDDKQHCTYMNAAAEALTGYTLEETRGRPLHNVIHHTYPDGRPFPLHECAIDSAFPERANTVGEEVFVHKDGTFYPVAFVASPIVDATCKTIGTIIEARDISAEKRAKDELAASEAQFRTTAEALPGLLFLANDDGNFYVNEAYRAYTGLPNDALLGMRWVDVVHPDDREMGATIWAEASEAGSPFMAEYRFRRHDGTWRWHSVRALPVRDTKGSVTSWVGTCLDIHQHKLSEERLQREVRRAVAEREDALAQLHEAQKLETLGQLTGGVAHDFNNLLTPIMMGLDMLGRAHKDERSQMLIAGALQSTERARTLVQRLLAFARRQTLAPRAVDPSILINDMRDLIEKSLGPAITVSIDMPHDLPVALVDPNQLELAILNLAVNGRDAMPKGGLLTIRSDCHSATDGEIPGLKAGEYVRVLVSDTGHGMDSETLGRAVEPFFSTKDVGQGTGLGLSMVHGLAAQSGGVFRLVSEVDVGTTAELWLPVTDAVAECNPKRLPHAPKAKNAATILLVDDEELVRIATAEGLRSLGYDVVEAASAIQALDRVRNGLRPDLVVTDHMMPGMTGAALASELHRDCPSLPVLLVTGYADIDLDQCSGVSALKKPFGQAELAAEVAALVGKS